VALIVAAAALACVWRGRLATRKKLQYGVAVDTGLILFCALLRWQPWNSRLQLPSFVLAAPFVALVVDRLARPLSAVLVGLLLLAAVPYLLNNSARPLVGPNSVLRASREQLYFVNRPALWAPYVAARAALHAQGCVDVGFVAHTDDWEYPLWVLIDDPAEPVTIQHVAVPNASARLGRPFTPCAIVSVETDQAPFVMVEGRPYASTFSSPPVTILEPGRGAA
jgi:hypothetical protein